MMVTRSRPVRLLPLLALPLLLTGCPGEYGGGYDKVAFRERTPVAPAAAPDPPPVVAGVGVAAPAELPQLSPDLAPPGVTQAMVEEGQQLYGTVCTACHGAAGTGSPVGPPLNDQDWIHIGGQFDEIVTITQTGVANPVQYPGAMPPLGGGNFTLDQVRSISAYVFALSHQAGP